MKKIIKYNKKGYVFNTKSIISTMLAFTTFSVMARSCDNDEVIEYINENNLQNYSIENEYTQSTDVTLSSNVVNETLPTETVISDSTSDTTESESNVSSEIDLNDTVVCDYELPLSFDNDLIRQAVRECALTPNGVWLNYITLGYDNLAMRSSLQSFTLSQDSNADPDVTIDNYRYFLYYDTPLYYRDNSSIYSFLSETPYISQISRAVCSENNLRFLIDEIPSSYFYERFPEFMRIVDNGGIEELGLNRSNYWNVFESFANHENDLSPYEQDYCEFAACAMYNYARSTFIYNYGAETFDRDYQNDVRQVRDQRNNRHVLVPTEEQYNEIMENLHEVPTFENIDIYQVETREEYFDAYGVYPEDVLSEERYDLNYEPYVSPYEFDVVQIDQNMNSNQGRSRTPN